jgi:hypothetical protein
MKAPARNLECIGNCQEPVIGKSVGSKFDEWEEKGYRAQDVVGTEDKVRSSKSGAGLGPG